MILHSLFEKARYGQLSFQFGHPPGQRMSLLNIYLKANQPRARWKRLDTAQILKRFYFCERSLVISCSAWLPRIQQLEMKTMLPYFSWQNAETANDLRDRVFELRFPSVSPNIGMRSVRSVMPTAKLPTTLITGGFITQDQSESVSCLPMALARIRSSVASVRLNSPVMRPACIARIRSH